MAKELKPAHGSPNPKGRFDVWGFNAELKTARSDEDKPVKKPKEPEQEQREKDAANQPLNEAFEAFF